MATAPDLRGEMTCLGSTHIHSALYASESFRRRNRRRRMVDMVERQKNAVKAAALSSV